MRNVDPVQKGIGVLGIALLKGTNGGRITQLILHATFSSLEHLRWARTTDKLGGRHRFCIEEQPHDSSMQIRLVSKQRKCKNLKA